MVTDVRKMNFDLLCPISYPADSHVMARRICNSSQIHALI